MAGSSTRRSKRLRRNASNGVGGLYGNSIIQPWLNSRTPFHPTGGGNSNSTSLRRGACSWPDTRIYVKHTDCNDHPTQLWAEAEVIARMYDVVPTLDTSRGSTSNPTPAGPIAVPVFAGPQHQSSIGKAVQNYVTKINQSEGRANGSNDNDKTPIQQIPRTHPGYNMVFNQTCAAPQKFSRQPLGPVVPLRTIDWNSYAPRTRTRTIQMQSVQKPEPQVVYDWMATNVNLDRNAELFNYGGWSARREDYVVIGRQSSGGCYNQCLSITAKL
nr:uncharacterized protein LOC109147029 [Ipomoea batatas]